MKYLIIGLLWLFIPLQTFSQNQDSIQGDLDALVDLYQATDGNNWNNDSGWLDGAPSNSWHGVEVDSRGRVIKINLSKNNLRGELPASIGNLSKLKYINLKQNKLIGEIPSSIGSWTEIEWMMLSGRYAEDLSTNPNRAYHPGKSDASGNNFSGEFPDVWSNFKKLKYFQLSGSSLTHIFYESMSANSELLQIVASYNPLLTQELPKSWSTFTKIQKIYITQSGLTGTFPDPNNWIDIRFINLGGDNEVGGQLPDFSNNKMLRGLFLHGQNFTGEFPAYFNNGQFTNLINLGLAWNDLSGKLSEFNNLNLRVLSLDGNNFTGSIPESITSMKDLIILGIGWNNFTGKIPQTGWDDLTNLRYLQFQDNELEGKIPEDLPNSSSLQRLEFNNNNLSGFLSTNHGKYADANNYPVFAHLRIDNNNFQPSDYEDLKAILGDKLKVGDQNPDDGSTDEPTAPSTPSPQTPSDGSSGASFNPTFSWSSVSADSYTLRVYTSSGSLLFENIGTGTSYSTSSNQTLDKNTEYSWRVRATRDGLTSDWSSVAEFTTQSEDGANDNNGNGPQKTTPAKDEKNIPNRPTFKWASVEEADSYTIEVREASVSSLLVEEEVTETMFVSNHELKGNTEYVWRVRATVQGQTGEWSDEWQFTTEDDIEEMAFEVELKQNYPNPFNPSTNIRFDLAEQQEVSLKVYDMAGRLVASLIDGSTLSAGTHNASFNAQSLASGIYFYRLITPGEIVTRKMTLMK